MSISRRIARPLLASMFVSGGLDAIRNPESKVKRAEAVTQTLTNQVPGLPKDTVTLIKWNGMPRSLQAHCWLSVSSGGWRPWRSSAQYSTTYAGHRFWEETDDAARAQQRVHFLKNLGLLGGLILAAFDTGRCSFAGVEGPARHTSAEKCCGLGPGIFHIAHSPSNLKDSQRREEGEAPSPKDSGSSYSPCQ